MCPEAGVRISLSHRASGGSGPAGLPRYRLRYRDTGGCGGWAGMCDCLPGCGGPGGEIQGCLAYGAMGGGGHWLFCPQDGLKQQLQASAPPDSVPSLQNMALLLDRLAKENQDIRLLQAQLQVGISEGGPQAGPSGQVPLLASSPQTSFLYSLPRPPSFLTSVSFLVLFMSHMLRCRPRLASVLCMACCPCFLGMVCLQHCVEKDLKNMPRFNGKEGL